MCLIMFALNHQACMRLRSHTETVFFKRLRNLCFRFCSLQNLDQCFDSPCSIRLFMEDQIRVFRVSNSFGVTSQIAKMCCKIQPFHNCPNSTEFGSFKLIMYLGHIFLSFQVELQARLSIIGGVRIGPQHFNIRDYPKNNNVTLYS